MASRSKLSIRHGVCPRCGGDAFLDLWDEPEWRCLQCGRPIVRREPVLQAAPAVAARAA